MEDFRSVAREICDMAFSGSLIPKLPTPPEASEDLLESAFKESDAFGSLGSDSDIEDEHLPDVVALINENRMHRTSLLKSLLLNNLSTERDRFISVFQKKASYVASYIDFECSELYLSLQKDIRSHNLLRKEGYRFMSNTSLEVEYITDRIFFFLNRLRFVHKGFLKTYSAINDLCIDKLYDVQRARIEKHMTSIVSKHKDGLLISMERDPHAAYQRFFSVFPRYRVSKYIEEFYTQNAIDRVNADLNELQSFAESYISKARVGMAKGSRVVSRPFLLRNFYL